MYVEVTLNLRSGGSSGARGARATPTVTKDRQCAPTLVGVLRCCVLFSVWCWCVKQSNIANVQHVSEGECPFPMPVSLPALGISVLASKQASFALSTYMLFPCIC